MELKFIDGFGSAESKKIFCCKYSMLAVKWTQWQVQTRRLGGAKKVFTCLNTNVCLRQSSGITQKWSHFVSQKVAIFVGRTMRFFREKLQFESAVYH